MATQTLYEIESRYHSALDMLYDPEIPEDVVIDTLESIEGEMEIKAENYAAIISNIEATAAAIRDAERKQAERRKAMENKAARLRLRLMEAMQLGGVPKFETPRFRIAVRQNPESVVIDDEAAIPDDYKREIRASYVIDKALVKAALQDGYAVPGVRLQRGARLEIK